jgi:sigma-B regulation protein RsbU (phosphoserine phosphatase)
MSAKEWIEKVLNNGVREDAPFAERNKLRIFNAAIANAMLINIFYGAVGFINHFYIAALITVLFSVICVASYLFVRNCRYLIGFHFTMWASFIFITAMTVLFSGANSAYFYFLFFPVAICILFDSLLWNVVYFVASMIFMCGSMYYFKHYPSYYPYQEWMAQFSFPNVIFTGILIFLGVRMFKNENILYSNKIEEQRHLVEEKNKEITDSINYAKRIQSSLIPSEEDFTSGFQEAFVYFKPKDIVSGDFYWIHKTKEELYFSVADCTGHGVPGGFMTMLGITFLEEIIGEKNISSPAEILDQLRDKLINSMKQTGAVGENKDGMDIVVCKLDVKSGHLIYAAANNSLYTLHNGELREHKGDKQPCGFNHSMKKFSQFELHLHKGDVLFAATDGLADQFGGPKGKKFKYKQMEEIFLKAASSDLKIQKEELSSRFSNWKGNLEQVDDVCVVGMKL